MPKPVTFDGEDVVPGVNVDRIDVEAGVAEAVQIGYDDANMRMLVGYCLGRWGKGEEDHAQRTALHGGIDLSAWYRILAAARAGAEEHVQIYADLDKVIKESMRPSADEDYSAELHRLVTTIQRGRRSTS